jgi:hypothetical protein
VPFTANGDLGPGRCDGFAIYSCNDVEFGEFVRAGGTGGVSGVSSAFPAFFVDLADALRRGDEQAAADGPTLRGLPSGPVRVALDRPSRSQLDTLRSASEDLT